MHLSPQWASPVTTRSRVVLEIAAELVGDPEQPYAQAKVLMRRQSAPDWPLSLFGSSTIEGVHAVVSGEAQLAIVNPSSALTLAYRGTGPFRSPQPVRTIAVIPSLDLYVFAVRPETGLRTFEEIAERRVPLRVALRGQPDHAAQFMLHDIAAAAGFTLEQLERWGGTVLREGPLPAPETAKFKALVAGELDAVFDEAVKSWAGAALAAGMRLLTLSEETVQRLETLGYRRAVLRKERFPQLAEDLLSIDFSGWPILVREDAPDALVTQVCRALDARKHLIPWQGEGPLPVDRMVADAEDTPLDVPFHPAAERFWRERGYL